MVYEQLYQCSTNLASVRLILGAFFYLSVYYIWGAFFTKTINPLVLLAYEIIMANSLLRASLAIIAYPVAECPWNNL